MSTRSLQQLIELFDKKTVVVLEEMQEALSAASRATVFRYLALGCSLQDRTGSATYGASRGRSHRTYRSNKTNRTRSAVLFKIGRSARPMCPIVTYWSYESALSAPL